MDLIIDASSIINLDNVQALETVSRLRECIFYVSPLVIGECQPTCAARLGQLNLDGLLRFVGPQDVSAESFLELLEQHNLGEGETECLALTLSHPYIFCSDDEKARRVGISLIGEDRVIGSLRLLKWLVADGLATAAEAFVFYEGMKEAGGFLPMMTREWFDRD